MHAEGWFRKAEKSEFRYHCEQVGQNLGINKGWNT